MSDDHSRTPGSLRLPGLDGLRGVAALMVFIYHLRWHSRPSPEIPLTLPIAGLHLEPLLTRLDIGVAVFFTLSGMLLSLPFWKAIIANAPLPDARRFLWRRACRIIPAYYSILIVAYLMRSGTYTFYGFLDFALHALFLHTFTDYTYTSVVGVLWTIGIEMQFYLCLPAIMAAVGWLWKRVRPAAVIFTLLCFSWAIDLGATLALRTLEPHVPDRFLAVDGEVMNSGTVCAYFRMFSFGIIGGLVSLRWKPSRVVSDITCLIASIALCVLLVLGSEAGWRGNGLVAWPTNAIVIGMLIVAIPSSGISRRILESRPLVAAGTISYGIYLWHDVVLRAVFGGTIKNNFTGWPLFLTGGLIALGVTAAVATVSWVAIEKRALSLPYPARP